MPTRHIIPRKDEDAASWGWNFVVKIDAKPGNYNVGLEELNELQVSQANFQSMVDKAKAPDSNKIIIEQKNEARRDFESRATSIINFQLHNPMVTDEDRISLGLPVRDRIRTPIGPFINFPVLTAEAYSSRHVKVNFHDQNSASKAKPYGASGAKIAFEVRDTPPATADVLPHSKLATRTPYILEFPETERGKTVYIAACWVNEKGEDGSWSDIISQFIP